MPDASSILMPVLAWLVGAAFVARLAAAWARPPGSWFLLALVTSPPIGLLWLLIVGDPGTADTLQEKEARIRRAHPGRRDAREAALNEMACPHCEATVNPVTREGLHSAADEPWLLICDRCQNDIEPDA